MKWKEKMAALDYDESWMSKDNSTANPRGLLSIQKNSAGSDNFIRRLQSNALQCDNENGSATIPNLII